MKKKTSTDYSALFLNVLTFIAFFYSIVYFKPIPETEMFWVWISMSPTYVWAGIIISIACGFYFARNFDPTETRKPVPEEEGYSDYEVSSTINYLGSFFRQLWMPDFGSSLTAIILVLIIAFYKGSICLGEGTSLFGTILLLLTLNGLAFRLAYKTYFFFFVSKGIETLSLKNEINSRMKNKEYGHGYIGEDTRSVGRHS